jgi:hypothetical protein
MDQEAFLMDSWTGMVFFSACRRFHIDSRDNRILLMRELVRRKKVRYL